MVFPNSQEELQGLADDVASLLDAAAAGVLDTSAPLERMLAAILEAVDEELQLRLARASL